MMKQVLRLTGLGLVALIGLVVLTAIVARFSDGPIALFPGGSLESGDWVEGPVADWSFAAQIEEIEMQLAAQAISRTTWIVVLEGQAYVPCSLGFPPGKTWHEEALKDGRAILRIDGNRYRVNLSKLDDDAIATRLVEAVGKKYGGSPGGDGGVWFFRLDPTS
ncbi:MAG: hypothetical protein JRH01_11110 [Deltaproteobacteria bacterium]|nr:hypothetical protein [Deltaproteobacteria bacterium]MBW2394535.1 hypothetical protein [Deltaproteobacteria bacterium]